MHKVITELSISDEDNGTCVNEVVNKTSKNIIIDFSPEGISLANFAFFIVKCLMKKPF